MLSAHSTWIFAGSCYKKLGTSRLIACRKSISKLGLPRIFFTWNCTPRWDLVPENWYCSPEVHKTTASKKRLDFLVAELHPQLNPREKESYRNRTGYELKVNRGSYQDFEVPLEQSVGYAKQPKIDIYLVNFVTGHQTPERTGVIWDSGYHVLLSMFITVKIIVTLQSSAASGLRRLRFLNLLCKYPLWHTPYDEDPADLCYV